MPHAPDRTPVPFASVDIRTALADRPYRPPDYEAEHHALAVLAAELAASPRNMLQKLAGICILETQDGADVFRWEAVAGIFPEFRNQTIARDASPCGVCIDEDATQLLYLPDRCFAAARADPRIVEALLVPFHCHGRPVGTVCIVTHRQDRKFDREDERLTRTLAVFAAAGWQLWRANAALANLPATLVRELETERRLLAHELRDDLSQKLAALSMEAYAVSQPRMRDLGQRIGGVADEIHRLSQQLHSAVLDDLGLEAALREECAAFSRRSSIPVRFEAEDVPRFLPVDIALSLFRVARECLCTIAKLAGAREVCLCLVRGESGLSLFVEDPGNGFDAGRASRALIGMQERMRTFGGDLKFHSHPAGGTRIEAHVPLPD